VDDFSGWRIWRKRGRSDWGSVDEVRTRGYLLWEIAATITPAGTVDGSGVPIAGVPALSPTTHYNDTFTFQDGTTRDVLRFYDPNVLKGEPYYYAVTGIDNGTQNIHGVTPGAALEGSRYLNTNALSVSPFQPGVNSNNEIVVVPNPWSADSGVLLFSGNNRNRIVFTGLPPLAKLQIFTETGDLVFTIDHQSLSDTELWHQETTAGQIVNSGIYILAVTDARTFDFDTGAVTGKVKDAFVKFAIIR
jgi:hypothetical protein